MRTSRKELEVMAQMFLLTRIESLLSKFISAITRTAMAKRA